MRAGMPDSGGNPSQTAPNTSFTIPQRTALSRLEGRITKGLKIFSEKYKNQCSETDVILLPLRLKY